MHRPYGAERRGKRKRSTIFLKRTKEGHRQSDQDRGVGRGNARRSSLKGRERVIVNQTRIEALEEEALESSLKGRDMAVASQANVAGTSGRRGGAQLGFPDLNLTEYSIFKTALLSHQRN